MLRLWIFRLIPLVLMATLLSVVPAQPGDATRRYALVVGINEYQAKQLGTLNYAGRDAVGLGDVLEQAGYQVVRLTSGSKGERLQPTRENIDRELNTLLNGAKKGDVIVLAFAGHGVQFVGEEDSFFCPSDARPDAAQKATLLSMQDLYGRMEQSFATCVLLVDACRNDPGVRAAGKARNGVNASAAVPKGVAALFSCEAGEFAYESVERRHGLFFYHALERLRKAASDGEEMTFNALADHVQDRVPAEVKASHQATQTPVQKTNTGRVVLIPKTSLPRTFTNSVGVEFVLVPSGEFLMGSPKDEKKRNADEGPQRTVKISRFYCGKFEVTRGQFAAFVTATGHKTDQEQRTKFIFDDKTRDDGFGWDAVKKEFLREARFTWRDPGFAPTDEHPVVLVSWHDAQAFADWLNTRETRKGRYGLLREAEFEYAQRGGSETLYAHGEEAKDLVKYANVADFTAVKKFPEWTVIQADDGYLFTAPVGKFRANGFGLHDMTGNVWEWCADWYTKDLSQVVGLVDPLGPPNGDRRVVRSSPFYSLEGGNPHRSAHRYHDDPPLRDIGLGFRVCFRPE